jgi:hypothetical protein
MTTQAEAPSDSWLALPAVTTPSARTAFRAASPSRVVSGRTPSSRARVTSRCETAPVALSTTFMVAVIGTISAPKRPAAWAAAARCCEASE